MGAASPAHLGAKFTRPHYRALVVPGLLLLALAGAGFVLLARPVAAPIAQALPGDPSAVAVDSRTGHAFVTCLATGAVPGLVAMLDTRSGALLRTESVGYNPSTLAVDERAGRVFVLTGSATVVMLDATTGATLRTLGLNTLPDAVAVDGHAARVFIATADGRLDMLSAATGMILHTIALGGHPGAIVVDPTRGRGVVSTVTATQERVTVFDTRSGVLLHTVVIDATPGKAGGAVAIDRASGDAFLVQPATGRVSMVDVRRGLILHTAFVAPGLTAIAVSTQAGRVVATGEGSVKIALLDARSGHVLRTETTGSLPVGLVAAPRAMRLFVVRQGPASADGRPRGPGRVDVLDAWSGAVLRTVPVGGVPSAVAADPVARRLLVAYRGGVAVDDAAIWVPAWAQRWLPFLPPSSHRVSPGVSLLHTAN